MRGSVATMTRPLRRRNYRLYVYGQLFSTCGTWAQTVALAWLVLDITDSGTQVGLVTAAQYAPVLLFGAWGGVLADRFDNRANVLGVQTLMGVQAAVLAVAVLTGSDPLWLIYLLAAVQGLGVALDTPTRQSLVGQLVGDAELSSALSLNAGIVQVARVLGPAIGALLISLVGVGACFALNAATFLVIIVALLAMDRGEMLPATRRPRARRQVMTAVRYVLREPELRTPLVLTVVTSVFVNLQVILPLLAKETFDGGPGTYGLLASIEGAGALVGALWLASRTLPTKRLILVVTAGLGVALCVVAAAPNVPVAALVLIPVGVTLVSTGVGLNIAMQLGATPEFRGRVIALYFMVAFGSNVVGGPLVGWVAEAAGARWSLVLGAAPVLVTAAVISVRWRARLGEAVSATGAWAPGGAEEPGTGRSGPGQSGTGRSAPAGVPAS